MSPTRRRQVVNHVRDRLGVSERWACQVLGQPRSTQRHRPKERDDERRLVKRIIELAKGRSIGEVAKQLGITDQTYYRWRKEYGGLKTDQAKRLKELERENARLKKVVADLTLDKAILKEAANPNW